MAARRLRFARPASMLGLALLLVTIGVGSRAAQAARSTTTIAVAPFSWLASGAIASDQAGALPDVAALLARELSSRSAALVVAPADMSLGKEVGPGSSAAGNVRRWADLNGVDSVVIGRAERAKGGGVNVDVELRSGHSGVAEAEYRLEPQSDPELPAAVEKLATLILADLAEAEPAPLLPPVGAPRKKGGIARDDEDERPLSLMPGVRNDDPISINSEELEVVPLDGGRRLIFSRNVVVVQGDIRLDADRLEAIYPAGVSQPERLIAEGHVSVVQGERNARCQQATYERELQTITCRGKAEVVQGCDRVRGREIEFDLERERVHVIGAASVLIRSASDDGECESLAGPP